MQLVCPHRHGPFALQPLETKENLRWWLAYLLFVGSVCRQRLCIDFSVSRVNFLATLHSHLDGTCPCYFWSSLFNVDVSCSLYIYVVNYSFSLKCIEKNLVDYSYFHNRELNILEISGDKWVASVFYPCLKRRCTKSNRSLVISTGNNHGLAWAKWTSTFVFHSKGQSLTVLTFLCSYRSIRYRNILASSIPLFLSALSIEGLVKGY